MASNPLPGKLNALFTLGEDMADGAAAHETAIGILHFKEVVIRSRRVPLARGFARQCYLKPLAAQSNRQ